MEFEEVDRNRVIAWTNDKTHYYNNLVREAKEQDISKPFDIGDIVVVNEAYVRNEEILLNTGEEVEVLNMVEGANFSFPEIAVWVVTVSGSGQTFEVVNPAHKSMAKAKENKLRADAIRSGAWGTYYKFKEWFLDIRPPYSLTSHKSQGSTFETVYVDYRDIYKNRNLAEADRCFYTAITRASNKVVICY